MRELVDAEQPEQGERTDRQSWAVARGLLPEAGPRRTLAVATFVNQLGSGVFMVSAALFFTRSIGLSVERVGLGMGIGGLVGLLSGIPVGRLADRRGPREVYLLTLLCQAVAMAALVLVRSFWLFVLVVCVTELAGSASSAARAPLLRAVAGPRPTRYRAYLRSAVNLAGSAGALLAGLAIQLDSRGAYLCLVLGNALSFLASAAVVRRLPSVPPVAAPAGAPRRRALTDRPYLAFVALNGIASIQGDVLVFALPLWIVGQTQVPRWFVGATVLLNTVLVVLLQVRAGRGVETNAGAARAWWRAGWAFLAGAALIGAAAGRPGWFAAGLVLLGVTVFTVGEVLQAAGSFELRFNLAPAHAQGQYAAVAKWGSGLVGVASPSLLGLLCIGWRAPGWILLGAVLAAVGLAVPRVVRWAERA
ncbi:MFS transporter [Kitasatospora viridis]